MAHTKLFEITLKYFISADNEQSAQEEMLRAFGTNFVSMELKEIKAGFTYIHPSDEEEIQF